MRLFIAALALTVVVAAAGFYVVNLNDTSSELDSRWASSTESSELEIDHSAWQLLLDDYLVSDTDSGVNLFDYSGLLDDGREPLDEYVGYMVSVDPLTLNPREQKAYWINLYNVLTVQLILDNSPTVSITELGSNPLDFGPWNDVAASINGIELSLNDIEHRIIRPLYDDYRIHFAVNCASIGCPNLATGVFNAADLDEQLDAAASEYLNHPRGIHFDGDQLLLSSLFEWYASDFGDDQDGVLATLGRHVGADVRDALSKYDGTPEYAYDWGLNGYCSIDNECGQ